MVVPDVRISSGLRVKPMTLGCRELRESAAAEVAEVLVEHHVVQVDDVDLGGRSAR